VGVLPRTDAENLGHFGETDQRRDALARHLVYTIN
jgi:hypothetical protein